MLSIWGFFICIFLHVLAGRFQYPISQSVCSEPLRSSSHSGDAASWLPEVQVHLCELKIKLYEFRQHLSGMITLSRNCSQSLLLLFIIFFLPPRIIFCITSSGKTTSPWWAGSAAPGSRFAGWTVPRTNQCSACARPPRGHAQRWAAVAFSVLVVWRVFCCNIVI